MKRKYQNVSIDVILKNRWLSAEAERKLYFELVCARRHGPAKDNDFLGTRPIRWTMDAFPDDTYFENKGDCVTAFFLSPRGIKREIDIFLEDQCQTT